MNDVMIAEMKQKHTTVSTVISLLLLIASSSYVLVFSLISGAFREGVGIAGSQAQTSDYLAILLIPIAFAVYVQALRGRLPRYVMWIAAISPVVFIEIAAKLYWQL